MKKEARGIKVVKIPLAEPCASCSTPCCSRFAVPVTASDVARICAANGKKPEEFVELAPFESIEPSAHSGIFFFKSGKLYEKTLILKRRIFEHAKMCVFWKGGKCSVWMSHPIACRVYPFALGENGEISYAKHLVCPRKWRDGEYSEADARKNIAQQISDIDAHNRIIRKWNATMARKKGADEIKFLGFLLKESKKGN